jgi:hypothetical protein
MVDLIEKLKQDFAVYLDSVQTETWKNIAETVNTSENIVSEYKQARATNYIAFGLQRYYKLLKTLEGGYIAGGVFKNLFTKEKGRDLDIFFETQEAFEKGVEIIKSNPKYKNHYENDNCIAFRHKETGVVVELVRTRFLPVPNMLDVFDFTIVKAALKMNSDGQLIFTYHKDFFEHLMTKRLVIVSEPPLPVNTLQRTWKYANYGYGLCRESKALLTKAVIEKGDVQNLSNELYFGID